jgi:hypothetical protein
MRLPPELRFGIGRDSFLVWGSGCIGYPWGSVLVGVGRGCEGARFSEILTADKEPLARRCAGVTDIYSPDAACIVIP